MYMLIQFLGVCRTLTRDFDGCWKETESKANKLKQKVLCGPPNVGDVHGPYGCFTVMMKNREGFLTLKYVGRVPSLLILDTQHV